MSKVFVVDEEYHFAENVLSILRIDGFDAQRFADATEAYRYFASRANDPEIAKAQLLIDVSLAPGDDRRMFGPERTEGFLKTGIVLVDALAAACPDLCRRENTVLYTAHYTSGLWNDILKFCSSRGFRSWQKRPDAEPRDILALVQPS